MGHSAVSLFQSGPLGMTPSRVTVPFLYFLMGHSNLYFFPYFFFKDSECIRFFKIVIYLWGLGIEYGMTSQRL